MLYVYLIYGLAFVIMGFSMAYQSFSAFRILPRTPLLMLATFGITHGTFEIQKMFETIEMRGIAYVSPAAIDYVTLFLLPISFMFLLAFALELMIHEAIASRIWRVLYSAVPVLLALLVVIPGWSKFGAAEDWPLRLETASRYFIAFPAGLLSSYVLLRLASRIKDGERFRFTLAMYASACALFVYAIVSGLLMPNPTGFLGYPEHGVSLAPLILEIRTVVALCLTFILSYAFIIELANLEVTMRRMRDEFSSVLAHDIGNIVGAIKMSSEIVSAESSAAQLGETTQRLMRVIDSNTKLLQSLISELFDLSLIELHRFKVERRMGDLRQIINQTCDQMRPLLSDRSLIVLLPETELAATFDHKRVGQILINLLSNAAKYSHQGSEVIVSAYDQGKTLKVTVTSTGPPIKKSEASRLFTRYYRTKGAGSQIGAGLGLFIVKELTEAHGGEVFVEASETGKTEFGFTLPKTEPGLASSGISLAENAHFKL